MSALPPLVAVGPPLSAESTERYSRQMMLPGIGEEGQRRIRAARVAVVGAGGLGTPAMAILAGAGVGALGIVDDDVVERSNLQRQLLHDEIDVGRPKTASARDAVLASNPEVDVRLHTLRLSTENAAEILAGYDLVLDGSDNFATRYLVDDAAAEIDLPVVWGSALQFGGQVSVFLASQGYRYRHLYPDAPSNAPSCGSAGVLGPVCTIVGAQMAAEALKLITGVGDPLLGRLAVVDGLHGGMRVLSLGATSPTRPGLITATQLRTALAQNASIALVDVRDPEEGELLPGAVRLPLKEIERGVSPSTGADEQVVVYCATGVRSQRAAQLLSERGFARARSLSGGMAAWQTRAGSAAGAVT